MRVVCTAVIALILGCAVVSAAEDTPAKVGDVVFETEFEGDEALAGWTGAPKLEPGHESQQSLALERTDPDQPSAMSYHEVPVEQIRGCLLHVSGWARAQDVSEKPRSWNGVKLMLRIEAEGGMQHPQALIGVGSFDWQHFVYPVSVPRDVKRIQLCLGLEAVTGKAWFDDITITVRKLPFVPKPPAQAGPVYKGHDLPRLRGAMISPRVDEESLRLFGQEWKANVVRWQLVGWRPQGNTLDLAAYDAWLDEQLALLDAALPLCQKYGLYVVVDLHSPPGGGAESGRTLFSDAACQDKFLENWRKMARKYRDSRIVWGYDLLNEPMEQAVAEGLDDWQQLAERAAKAIREIDPDHAIIVEPPQGGNPFGLVQFNPIDVPRVVYSVHMYLPHSFTHQGVHGQWTKQYAYPGEIDGQQWDKARLEEALKPVVEFQQTYNVHIYIGEFSAIRWAPDNSAYRYLRDLVDIYEANDWDWTYHAFREWSGWSVEHGPDPKNTERMETPTDREKLLRGWFAKNEKPPWYRE